jgi:hypothetical protein
MVDHVVDNDFVDFIENIEPAGPSEPESTVSGEESEDLQDQEGSQSAALQDFYAGKEESPWPKLNTFFSVCCKRNNNLSFECLFCKPKKTVLPHILHHTPTFRHKIEIGQKLHTSRNL